MRDKEQLGEHHHLSSIVYHGGWGGWWIFFFRLPERLVTKLASLGCSFRWSLWLTFWPSCDFSFVETAAAGTGALYIGDMTNGRLIRWPIGAKQGEKPKLNFHGWSSYPFNVPPARNEGLIAGLNSPDHKTLFLGGTMRGTLIVRGPYPYFLCFPMGFLGMKKSINTHVI